jgi:hypothetical protein
MSTQSAKGHYDTDSDDEGPPDISDDAYIKCKAAIHHVSASEVKGKDPDFSRTITTLTNAFKNASINKIMTRPDLKWNEYKLDDRNKKNVAIMEPVPMQVLESTLKTAGHAPTAFNTSKSQKLIPRQTHNTIHENSVFLVL